LSTLKDNFFILKNDVSERIRRARENLGLKQSELAVIGKISRATQISYESGNTEPTTSYLREIQAAGVDIPFVLFGQSLVDFDQRPDIHKTVDWQLLQQAHGHVEFFCLRIAPQCPTIYRWKMVEQLYNIFDAKKRSTETHLEQEPFTDPFEEISRIWENYESKTR
jgi:transcriptional regulator with XRE-family HTH domain